ncbi:DUF4321 domain-containing protein [Alicyclobacillus tolerans]|uniref:DUF4321 domain-containing protein n=1 Tax=Alicyclobacillus tolerans TaxID=90970 RepID=UPI001F1DE055|nr:DUF4321 domain-containing protein [Alicyclobacillus tolerans]MCF8563551.1 DUF4321 domain-containing protein [Alicyclobacillus tolerans]
MRNSIWRTAGFLFAGAVLGTLAGQLLAPQVPLLRHQTQLQWNPSADWAVLRFSLNVTLRVNWLTLVGVVAAYLLRRRIK